MASPVAILVVVPVMVAAAGLIVLLLGRSATRGVSQSMARSQLIEQAAHIDRELALALDQASPMLERLRALAIADESIEAVAPLLHELTSARAGVANVSISYPTGVLRGSFIEAGKVFVQESRVGDGGTLRRNFSVEGGIAREVRRLSTQYDPRTRSHYTQALRDRHRGWTPPRVFFTSRSTGLTCTEPVFDDRGNLIAVTTVDFDVGALSRFMRKPPLAGARTLVFARDGSILAYPDERAPPMPEDGRLLKPGDLGDATVDALFAELDRAQWPVVLTFYRLADGGTGGALASVAPVAGVRAGVSTSLNWYVATIVPESTLLGPSRQLERKSLWASAIAVVAAMAVAAFFAWYVIVLRTEMASSRARAKAAEERVRQLGSYRLVERLGSGGMGEVWKAEHQLLAREAAIKLIRRDSTEGEASLATVDRFRREAQAVATLRSRHTVELYDYGVASDGTFYYVMELLDGLDLQRLVLDHGPQPAARVIRFLVQALSSLKEAHSAGLLHRDIKPANLFACRAADEFDLVKVLDFGIVHVEGETTGASGSSVVPMEAPNPDPRLTRAGLMLGTPGYISPEQARGQVLDGRSDLYALGCVAFWLLTGRGVFDGANDLATMYQHAHDPAPLVTEFTSAWVPEALVQAISSCLAKRPQDRPADAHTLAATLRSIAIPAEHEWTNAQARAWWLTKLASPATPGSNAATAQWLVPQMTRGEQSV